MVQGVQQDNSLGGVEIQYLTKHQLTCSHTHQNSTYLNYLLKTQILYYSTIYNVHQALENIS